MPEEMKINFQQIMSMIQNERQSLQALERQLAELQAMLEETLTTKAALRELAKQKKTADTLIHLGTGIYVKSEIAEPGAVFMTLGGAVVTKTTIDGATAALNNREKEVRQQLQESSEQRHKASQNLQELTRAVQETQAAQAQSQHR